MDDLEVLGTPRPRAWAYLSCPSWYPHAEKQWRLELGELASKEGYALERWWVDHFASNIDAINMLEMLPGSGIKALFIPEPRALAHLHFLKNYTPADIATLFGLQVFVLDETIRITPPDNNAAFIQELAPAPRRRLRGLLRRRQVS